MICIMSLKCVAQIIHPDTWVHIREVLLPDALLHSAQVRLGHANGELDAQPPHGLEAGAREQVVQDRHRREDVLELEAEHVIRAWPRDPDAEVLERVRRDGRERAGDGQEHRRGRVYAEPAQRDALREGQECFVRCPSAAGYRYTEERDVPSSSKPRLHP